VLFNIVSGAVTPTDGGSVYWNAWLNYAGMLNLDLIGKSVPNDAPFFGTSNDIATVPTTDGVPLTFSCAGSSGLAASNPTLPALGPWWNGATGTGGSGGASDFCPGSPPAQPGFNTVSMSGLTAFVASSLEFLGAPPNDPATSPAWGPFDYKFEEAIDPDGDGVVSGLTTLGKQFVLDNCPYESNASQSDVGGAGVTANNADMIGDVCQCGDVNNDGKANGIDGLYFTRANLGLSPYFAIASMPGYPAKCNVNATATCVGADALSISRWALGLSPAVQQTCAAALP
jgi:hypothetical protein